MKGLVLDIEHFAVHDGPGIRQVVFLKGCPLRCAWCHTPESQSGKVEILWQSGRCLHCGLCGNLFKKLPRSSWSDDEIRQAKMCSSGALKVSGYYMSAGEIVAEALKERMFFEESGGGLTISGGEALFQADFTTEILLEAARNDIRCCVETCGYGQFKYLEKWIPLTEIFLYDFKVSDPQRHLKLTGVDNTLIKDNLRLLSEKGARIFLRCPLIPGVNDSMEHLLNIAEIAEKLSGIEMVHIIPYHPMARSKYQQLGRGFEDLPADFPEQEQIDHYVKTVTGHTSKPVCVP